MNTWFLNDAGPRTLVSGGICSGVCAMAVFDPREEALIRLALDAAASKGEQENAASALIRSLRKRGVKPEALLTGSELAIRQQTPSVNPGAVKMPWGKFKGLRLEEIDEKYLRWCLWKCSKATICADIRRFLRLPQK